MPCNFLPPPPPPCHACHPPSLFCLHLLWHFLCLYSLPAMVLLDRQVLSMPGSPRSGSLSVSGSVAPPHRKFPLPVTEALCAFPLPPHYIVVIVVTPHPKPLTVTFKPIDSTALWASFWHLGEWRGRGRRRKEEWNEGKEGSPLSPPHSRTLHARALSMPLSFLCSLLSTHTSIYIYTISQSNIPGWAWSGGVLGC